MRNNISSYNTKKVETEGVINAATLWEGVLDNIKTSVQDTTFATWFKGTHIIKFKDGVVHIGVQNEFTRSWLNQKHYRLILKELRDKVESVRAIKFVVSTNIKSLANRERKINVKNNTNKSGDLALERYQIDREDNLNPRYTFDTFVVAPFNEIASTAAEAVVNKPGMTYNPFFVYGPAGVGKTHLLQAIGNKLKSLNTNLRGYYVTSEMFCSDFLNSIKRGDIGRFVGKFEKYDFLIFDDTQFLMNKEKTMEALFNVFNRLHQSNKQMVLSSDVHPADLNGAEERLKSRFCSGITLGLNAPDFESRCMIIKEKMRERGLSLQESTVELIAKDVEASVRELEGIMNLILIHMEMKNGDLSVENIRTLVKQFIRPKKAVSMQEVIRKVCNFYDIKEETVMSSMRSRKIVQARQLIMYILREYANIPFSTIGQYLKRDHTTVIHSCEKIKKELTKNKVLAEDFRQLRGILNM